MNYIQEIYRRIDTNPEYHHLSTAQKKALHQDLGAIYEAYTSMAQQNLQLSIPIEINWASNIESIIPIVDRDLLWDANKNADYIYQSDENVEPELIIANNEIIIIRNTQMGGDWQQPVDATLTIMPTKITYVADNTYHHWYLMHYANQLAAISRLLFEKPLANMNKDEAFVLLNDLINVLYILFSNNTPDIMTSKEVFDEFDNFYYGYKPTISLAQCQLIIDQRFK